MEETTGISGLLRQIRACHNARLPGTRIAFHAGAGQVGWVQPALATALSRFDEIHAEPARITLAKPEALPAIARALADRGFFRHRNELFAVRAVTDGPVLTTIDRGALPAFGIAADGVHVNGLVRRAEGLFLWIARRSSAKELDPGKLDHLVAGGVPAGLGPDETLLKEAAEEAALPADIAAGAVRKTVIRYTMEREEGLRRDRLFCYDLELPESFVPRAADGEVESFELWPIARALASVRDTDDFKFNVRLVLIDLFLREGLLGAALAAVLRTELDRGHL